MKKILATLLGLLILLQLFAGCEVPVPEPSEGTINSENDATPSDGTANSGVELSNATLYGYANNWVDEAFLNENRVYHAFYRDESGETLEMDAPRTRSFIVTTEAEYRELCPGASIDVDFEREMIILYISPSINPPLNAEKSKLEKATFCEGALTVRIEEEPTADEWAVDACKPYALCLALKTEKAEITEATFEGISMLYYTELQTPFAGKTIHFCKYIYNLDDSADYIYVEFKEGGYVIFTRETREMLEFSFGGALPYSASTAQNYYGGPFSYLQKHDSVFINMRTNEKLDSSREDAEAFAQQIRNTFLSKTEYRTNLACTKGNVGNEANDFFCSLKSKK